MSVTYISSLSFDARKKLIGVYLIEENLATRILCTRSLNFCLGAALLNFAIFSLIFDARKKKISASDRVIPCQEFLFVQDF